MESAKSLLRLTTSLLEAEEGDALNLREDWVDALCLELMDIEMRRRKNLCQQRITYFFQS